MTACEPIRLIVNADDYGYYPCVSRGIVDAARGKGISAAGVLPNSPNLQERLRWLDGIERLDVGVHLNLSHGRPLTPGMAQKLSNYSGNFPGVYRMSAMMMLGQIRIQDVRAEWQSQIEVCQVRKLMFLNSHEHIHMLPVLFSLAAELAQEFNIPYLRLTRAEWLGALDMKTWIRNSLIQVMHAIDARRCKIQAPILLGVGQSGKLSFEYLEKIFASLKPGQTYELMCHPGYFNPDEISDARLHAYHDWEGELRLLQSPELHDLYAKYAIRLSRYHPI